MFYDGFDVWSCSNKEAWKRLVGGFWFLFCYAVTQLKTQLHQRRIQVVRRNKVAWKRLTESERRTALPQ